MKKKMILLAAMMVVSMGVNACGMTDNMSKMPETESEVNEITLDKNADVMAEVLKGKNEITSEVTSEAESEVESESETEAVLETESELEQDTQVEQEDVSEVENESENEVENKQETESEQESEKETEQETEKEVQQTVEPSYTYKDLNQKMYAKSSVNVRSLPSTDGNKLGKLQKFQEVVVTGQCNETGWYRIDFDGEAAYVSNKYLIEELPETPKKDEGQDYDEDDDTIKDTPYTNVLYTKDDCLGDGFDEYRVGLHRYTDDGKWELYVLKNWTFPDGNTYYGYFISNLDVEYSEAEVNFEGNWVLTGTPKYNDFNRAVFYMEDRYFLSISSRRVDFLPQYFKCKEVEPSLVHWADNPERAYEFVALSYYIPESEYTEEMYIHDYYEIKALFHYSFIASYSDGFTNEEGFYFGLEQEKVTYEEFLEYEKIAEKYNYDDYARAVYKPE